MGALTPTPLDLVGFVVKISINEAEASPEKFCGAYIFTFCRNFSYKCCFSSEQTVKIFCFFTDSQENKTREAHIPPLLGVAPLGPVPLQKEHQYQFQMLDNALCHLPVSADSERMRQFLPRNPYPTPHYYPQVRLKRTKYFLRIRHPIRKKYLMGG
jgi:hypothetical protein